MKCERCNKLDFNLVIPSLLGLPYVECEGCGQGYLVLDKLKLRYAELLGNVADNTDNCIMFRCGICKGLRLVESTKGDLVQSTQICNRCILETPDDGTTVKSAGEKISWDDFLNTARTFN